MDDPRGKARQQMFDSVGSLQWEYGKQVAYNIRESIYRHPIASNKAISILNQGHFSLDHMKNIHLEYRHAIVQAFTDALLKLRKPLPIRLDTTQDQM